MPTTSSARWTRPAIDRVVIGGTSMGGYTAMALCRRHPERVAGLALIDTKASADAAEAAAGRRAMAQVMADRQRPTHSLENVLPKLSGRRRSRTRPDVAATRARLGQHC